ncbi:MAG: hypothetical protein DRJ47_06505 [Thermoprotei archaeon]|nr:MAG: hypothetical protein DRJ47_06505 [Thermoprotei archaeon]
MADKYLSYDRSAGRIKEKEAVTQSSGAGDAYKIVALGSDGKLHSSLLPAGMMENTINLPAYEDLSAGDFVNIFDDSGTAKVRKADASSNKPAHGYVLSSAAAGDNVTVHFDGHNTQLTGLTPGTYYFLSDTTPGGVTDTPPSTSGCIAQRLGVAINSTTIDVEIEDPIELA